MNRIRIRSYCATFVLCAFCLFTFSAFAEPLTYAIDDVAVEGLTIDNLSTRSGPGTVYRDTGTYKVQGEWIRIYSYAYDKSGVCWVQCDVPYGDEFRRVYTGLKRFDANTVDLASIPCEDPESFETVKMLETATALYGPGLGYSAYDKLTADRGMKVKLIAVMDDFAQVEWAGSKQRYRAWVFLGSMDY